MGSAATDNLVPTEAMPYDNVTRKHFDSGDYRKSLLIARDKIGFDAVRKRQAAGEPDGRLIGIGFATYCDSRRTAPACSRPGACR